MLQFSNSTERFGRLRRRAWMVAFLTVFAVLVGMPAFAVDGTVWTTLPSLSTPRDGLAAAAAPCPSGQKGTCVYAVGGDNFSGPVESYSPATNRWSTQASLPTPREELAAAAAPCPSGQKGTCVYAIGGFTGSRIAGTVESYNPAANRWSTQASLSTPRDGLAAAAAPCPSGQKGTCVYAIGGSSATNAAEGTVESYNPATNAWTTQASLPTPRDGLAAAAAPCPSGQKGTCVYAIGGFAGSGRVGTVESYNPATNAWSTLASLATPLNGLAAAAAPCPPGQSGSCVYTMGGDNGIGRGQVGTVESYNPATNAWTTLSSLPTPRSFLAGATAMCPPGHRGTCIYAVGGIGNSGDVGTVEALDPPAGPDPKH
ncbi:Kelch repeat-containing protein [Streptomyces colonosanans]|uniref:Kelch repeat-containing protein n=1 Tax=Streptomyces colonosanans TaxID=1428652 RepID=UPI000AA2BF1B|nr:hypothetical protein [Streptomyces colonosanans]